MMSDKINNDERQKYDGILNVINKIFAVIIPLMLGILLTYISYTNLGKIFFVLFIVMFILSFKIKDEKYFFERKIDLKSFFAVLRKDKSIRNALLVPLLSGFTYSSGVLGTIVISVFKTNLNLGFVYSACSLVFLIVCGTTLLLEGLIINKVLKNKLS